ncbi:MAG TPA: protein-glutamine glutaminase family protein [Bacteriovoracaceae bacterium]|nr:protein-glutamine glutaminase family protein [Bacteriovoracaceae bacterium]
MKLLILSCLLFASSIWADTLTSTIHSIDFDKEGTDHFLKLDSGEVVFFDDVRVAEDLEAAKTNKMEIEFSIDDSNQLIYWESLDQIEDVIEPALTRDKRQTTSPVYQPSVVTERSTLASMFAGLRSDTRRRSECYHRAYIWAYEENKRSGRQLTKHFLFFTRRYIREYRYRWWFHVAPSTLFANESGKEEFIIFDRTFMKGAVPVKEWTDSFIASKRSCPVVYVYSQYNNNQESQHCYLIPTPMYYLQPLDIENFEKSGVEKTSFQTWDLNISYSRGFTGRRL